MFLHICWSIRMFVHINHRTDLQQIWREGSLESGIQPYPKILTSRLVTSTTNYMVLIFCCRFPIYYLSSPSSFQVHLQNA